jgi:thioester reductase-like protein
MGNVEDLPCDQLRLRDVPPSHIASRDMRGELLVHEKAVKFRGYFNDPEATSGAFVHGQPTDVDGAGRLIGESTEDGDARWYKSGDLVQLLERDDRRDPSSTRPLRVLGRVKFSIKLASGEFVLPDFVAEQLESHCRLPVAVFITSDSFHRVLFAVVAPQIGGPLLHDLPNFSQVTVEAAIRSAGEAAGLAAFEQPTHVILRPGPFLESNGEVGPAGKLVRHVIEDRIRQELDALADAKSSSSLLDQLVPQPQSDIAQTVRTLWEATLSSASSAGDELTFAEQFGGDSVTAVMFSARLLRLCGFRIRPAELSQLTLEQLCSRAREQGGEIYGRSTALNGSGAIALPAEQSDAESELVDADSTVLPPHVLEAAQAVKETSAARTLDAVPVRRILLTGATGLVGGAVLEVLEQLAESASPVDVHCIVRAADAAAAAKRMSQVLPRQPSENFSVHAYAGMVGRHRFGMSEVDWERLLDSGPFSGVLHLAGRADSSENYSELREANVSSVLEAANFALRVNARSSFAPPRLVIASTTDVLRGATSKVGSKHREELLSGTSADWADGGYAKTKSVAEVLANRISGDTGGVLPVTIARLGLVGSHRGDGRCSPKSFEVLLAQALKQFGAPSTGGLFPHLVPCDVAATSLALMAIDRPLPTGTEVFHIVNPSPPQSLEGVAQALGGPSPSRPAWEWLKQLREDPSLAILPVIFLPSAAYVTRWLGTKTVATANFAEFLRVHEDQFGELDRRMTDEKWDDRATAQRSLKFVA